MRYLRKLFVGRRTLDVSVTRRIRRQIVTGVLVFIAIGSCYYGFSHTTKADAINTTDFVTTWKTDNPGTSNSTSITIPTNLSYGYNYSVDWNNDGIIDQTAITGDVTHDFGVPGTYTIRISGQFPAIQVGNIGDKLKILSVDQWGAIQWRTMQLAFSGAANLTVPAIDAPDLSLAYEMSGMFANATSFNQPINHWNVSNITTMERLFQGATSFNQPLDNWDVSHVAWMTWMFYGATSFNQPLNTWDTSSLVYMYHMFAGATSFNQPLDAWDVSHVTDMYNMFDGATSFDQPLNNWNVSSVYTMDNAFHNATSFNQSLNSWNVSNVISMINMFAGATSFNQPLNSWNVSNVTQLQGMFDGASSFNQPIGSWNTNMVTDISYMFSDATAFNQPLDTWNMSSVTNMSWVFYNATSFNQPLNNWNVGQVTNMTGLFYGATSFNRPLTSWNTSSSILMTWMFAGATAFNQPLSSWDVSAIVDMAEMLSDSGVSRANYDLTLSAWSVQAVQSNVTLGANGLTYCAAEVARQSLIDDHAWIINGDSLSCTPGSPTTQNADFEPLGSGEDASVSQANLSVTSTECYTINLPSLSVLGPNGITAPEDNVRILGGLGYSLTCASAGGSTTATITLGTHFSDISKLRMYKKTGSSSLQDITDQVVIANKMNGSTPVTTIDYTLIDGGAFDEDGTVNGVIVDPVYVGLVTNQSVTSGTLADTGTSQFTGIWVGVTMFMTAGLLLFVPRSLRA